MRERAPTIARDPSKVDGYAIGIIRSRRLEFGGFVVDTAKGNEMIDQMRGAKRWSFLLIPVQGRQTHISLRGAIR